MPATYEPIATTTLGSAASTITFSSIPATYTDLRLILNYIQSGSFDARMQFNGDTATNYSSTRMSGDGTTAASSRQTSVNYILGSHTIQDGSAIKLMTADIFSYAGSTNKTALITSTEDRNGAGATMQLVGLWRSTSAITSINLLTSTNNFATGTIATLYGIKAA